MRVAPSTVARLCGLLALGVAVSAATQSGRNASAGVYTKTQAAHGAQVYAAHCTACHGDLLQGIDVAPPLTGSRFLANWLNQPADGLFTKIKTTMPQNEPGSLGSHDVADVMAYMFQTNGFAAGNSDLPANTDELQQIRIDAPL
jgi:mono/diheme cytochrome c family protein